jgi:hypothetical protein
MPMHVQAFAVQFTRNVMVPLLAITSCGLDLQTPRASVCSGCAFAQLLASRGTHVERPGEQGRT